MTAGHHWTENEYIEALYGVRAADNHLDSCDRCAPRWAELQTRRANIASAGPPVPDEYLAEQRRRIHDRIEAASRRGLRIRLTPALAAAAMVLLGVVLLQPEPRQEPTLAAEAGMYTEIYEQVMAAEEPRAASPIRALFENR
jgi:hypothetical protein